MMMWGAAKSGMIERNEFVALLTKRQEKKKKSYQTLQHIRTLGTANYIC